MIWCGLRHLHCQITFKQLPCGLCPSWRNTHFRKLSSSLVFDETVRTMANDLRSYEIPRGISVQTSSPVYCVLLIFLFPLILGWTAQMLQGKQGTMTQNHTLHSPACGSGDLNVLLCLIKSILFREQNVGGAHSHCRSQWARMELRLLQDLRKWKPKDSWTICFFFNQCYTVVSTQIVFNTWITDLRVESSESICHRETTLLMTLQFTQGSKDEEGHGHWKIWSEQEGGGIQNLKSLRCSFKRNLDTILSTTGHIARFPTQVHQGQNCCFKETLGFAAMRSEKNRQDQRPVRDDGWA